MVFFLLKQVCCIKLKNIDEQKNSMKLSLILLRRDSLPVSFQMLSSESMYGHYFID